MIVVFNGPFKRAILGEPPRINAWMLIRNVVAAVNRSRGLCLTERVTAKLTLEINTLGSVDKMLLMINIPIGLHTASPLRAIGPQAVGGQSPRAGYAAFIKFLNYRACLSSRQRQHGPTKAAMIKYTTAGDAQNNAAAPTHGRTPDMTEKSAYLAVSACVIYFNDPCAYCANTIVMRNGIPNGTSLEGTLRINVKEMFQSIIFAVNRASGLCLTERVTATMTLEIMTWVPDTALCTEDSGVHGACQSVNLARRVMFSGQSGVEIIFHAMVNLVFRIAVVISGLGQPICKT
jgi:hypothetical protein